MELLSSCYFVSLHTGSVICATCRILLYSLATALEVWWIIESEIRLPIPADILCAAYIINLIVSIFLAVGLAGKKTRILLSCLVIIGVFYFIEAALVLYMTFAYWTLRNVNGIIEFVFWVFRAVFNVVVFVTIMSQYATWRDEKQVMMRLQSLSLNGTRILVQVPEGSTMKKDTSVQQQQQANGHVSVEQQHGAYDNPAYTSTMSDLTLNGSTTKQHGAANVTFAPDTRMKRSLSSASQIQLHRAPSLYGGSLPSHGQELNDPLNRQLQLLNPMALSYGGSTKSEFDASSFSGIFPFPVRSQSELSLQRGKERGGDGGGGGGRGDLGHKPRSLMYLDEDDYLARPPPSRPVSMGYVNVHRDFSTQSLDRSKNLRKGSYRRAASLEAIDVSEVQEVKLQKLAMRPFDYLNRPGSKPSDLNLESEDIRRIQDVAL